MESIYIQRYKPICIGLWAKKDCSRGKSPPSGENFNRPKLEDVWDIKKILFSRVITFKKQ